MKEHVVAVAVATPRAEAEAGVAVAESMFLSFLVMFASIYFVGYFIVFRGWGPPRRRAEAASCFTSLFHGTPAAMLALRAVLLSRYHAASRAGGTTLSLLALPALAAPNTAAEDLVLDFSTAYFAVDLAYYLLLLRDEALYIAHHLATLYVLATCRHADAAAAGAAVLLPLVVLAETTSAAQNAWTLAAMRRHDSPLAAKIYARLSLPFYTVARAVLGPAWFFRMARFFYASSGEGGCVPAWSSASWTVVIGAGIAVSILWVANLWLAYFRERNKESKQQ